MRALGWRQRGRARTWLLATRSLRQGLGRRSIPALICAPCSGSSCMLPDGPRYARLQLVERLCNEVLARFITTTPGRYACTALGIESFVHRPGRNSRVTPWSRRRASAAPWLAAAAPAIPTADCSTSILTTPNAAPRSSLNCMSAASAVHATTQLRSVSLACCRPERSTDPTRDALQGDRVLHTRMDRLVWPQSVARTDRQHTSRQVRRALLSPGQGQGHGRLTRTTQDL